MTHLDEWFTAVDRLLAGDLSGDWPAEPPRRRWQATVPTSGGELRIFDSADGVRLVFSEHGEEVAEYIVPNGHVAELAAELGRLP